MWYFVALGVVVGYLIGRILTILEANRHAEPERELDGVLVVDIRDGDAEVYMQIFTDLNELRNGQEVAFKVLKTKGDTHGA